MWGFCRREVIVFCHGSVLSFGQFSRLALRSLRLYAAFMSCCGFGQRVTMSLLV